MSMQMIVPFCCERSEIVTIMYEKAKISGTSGGTTVARRRGDEKNNIYESNGGTSNSRLDEALDVEGMKRMLRADKERPSVEMRDKDKT